MNTLTFDTNPYLKDILSQPEAVKNTLNALYDVSIPASITERIKSGELKRIVLTGMGSSYHGLHPLHLDLIENGLTSIMMETSELVYYAPKLFNANTLIVAVSQSGMSAEITRLLSKTKGRVQVIAVTNNADSPLTRQAEAALITRAGTENSVSCKTYVAMLAALSILSELLAGRGARDMLLTISETSLYMEQYLNEWREHVETLKSLLSNTAHLILSGRGASLAAVGTGGLIIKEAAHFPAEGMSCAAFRHGPLEMTSPGLFFLAFAGDVRTSALNAGLVEDVLAIKGSAALVSETSSAEVFKISAGSSWLRSIMEILPVQMISLALAQLRGHDAGRFANATKVTMTE